MGVGFWWVWVWVGLKYPRVTHANPYIGHKGNKAQMGENRQCNIEHKSDEGKGQWHKLSM